MENFSSLGTGAILFLLLFRELLNFIKERNGRASVTVTHILEQNAKLVDIVARLQVIHGDTANDLNNTRI
jgi:hypothetical protein